jgi:4-hydroxy-3-methylbut-2-en-1-yl diphosphate reductase
MLNKVSDEWSFTLSCKVNMKILRATHLGFCFGVRHALDLALDHPGPITVLGDLVHNETVLDDLRAHGVQFAQRIEQIFTPAAMITAHGSSDKTRQELSRRGLRVVEATCPLVRLAHQAVLKLARDGLHPVIIGKRDHVEVRGLTGDLEEFDVVLSEEEVRGLAERPRFGVAAQTTQPIERVRRLVELMRQRFPQSEVRFIDTVCQPTKQRQSAASELSLRSDVVIVIGGTHSNNTRELAATCGQFCPRVHLVQTAADLRAEWLAGAETVGLTAGTSTPDDIIQEVECWLNEHAAKLTPAPAATYSDHDEHAPALVGHAL